MHTVPLQGAIIRMNSSNLIINHHLTALQMVTVDHSSVNLEEELAAYKVFCVLTCPVPMIIIRDLHVYISSAHRVKRPGVAGPFVHYLTSEIRTSCYKQDSRNGPKGVQTRGAPLCYMTCAWEGLSPAYSCSPLTYVCTRGRIAIRSCASA